MSDAADAAEVTNQIINTMTSEDPYLAYQPTFAYTLPIQLFVNGITITLLMMLLVHLLFTMQYHYPLAPLNYSLQLSSVVVVFISVTVKIWYVLKHCGESADIWPYDLDYVAVPIPPASWTIAQDAAWFLLQALNNGLSNITHIQFLTMLFPSRTEARLIIFILGPIAIVSSGLVFTALSGSQKVLDVSDAIRNVLNSTLLLIFTIALIIWGFFVNRRRAWRTDGGTAAFGFGAMLLAVVSTTVNFVAVAEDGIDWLQHLLFAAVLWQIWLGWWWWVGSGMGIGEVEDLMERQERKKRKMARRASRQRAAANGKSDTTFNRTSSFAGMVDAGQASANAAISGLTSSVTGILRKRSGTASTLHRRNTRGGTSVAGSEPRRQLDEEEGGMELGTIRPASAPPETRHETIAATGPAENGATGTGRVEFSTPPDSRTGTFQQTTNSETSSTSATPSLHTPRTLGQALSYPTTWLQVYLRRLRKAHEDAAKKAALAQVERRQQVFEHNRSRLAAEDADTSGNEEVDQPRRSSPAGVDEEVGWGLGSFGIKEHRESARRLQAARERLQDGRLLSADEAEREPSPTPTVTPPSGPSRLQGEEEVVPAAPESSGPSRQRRNGNETSDWEDLDTDEDSSNDSSRAARKKAKEKKKKDKKGKGKDDNAGDDSGEDDEDGAGDGAGGNGHKDGGSGWSWWGPLKDWRLNDRSAF